MPKYTIRLDTPILGQAGTNADVEAKIGGENRVTTQWIVLDNPGDDREQGSQDYYRFYLDEPLGAIQTLEIRYKKWDNDSPDWYLSLAYVANVCGWESLRVLQPKWLYPQADWQVEVLDDPKLVGKISPFDLYQW